MPYCPQLDDIIEYSEFDNFNDYDDYMYYEVFLVELFNKRIYYKNKVVSLGTYMDELGREGSYYHLTCKDYNKTGREEDRKPDFRRTERLHWIKPTIETDHSVECAQNCVYIYDKPFKNKFRTHILNYEDRYMVVLEERKNYYYLVTAFYIDRDKTLDDKYQEYLKFSV